MGEIIWLASYPRSGNTWMRVFLANYLGSSNDAINPNDLVDIIACDRSIFDENVGVEASDLTLDEIDRLRPKVFESVASNNAGNLIVKIHDAFYISDVKEPIVSSVGSKGIIYIIRNPLDVAASSASFFNKPVEDIIKIMADKSHALNDNSEGIGAGLRQRLLTWNEHVLSWTDQNQIPIHIVRYEDMLYFPLQTFTSLIRFIDLIEDKFEIEAAIELSSFSVLKHQEEKYGFREKPIQTKAFFNKGKVGTWRETLSNAHRNQIISDHRDVMLRFGYLTENNEVIF